MCYLLILVNFHQKTKLPLFYLKFCCACILDSQRANNRCSTEPWYLRQIAGTHRDLVEHPALYKWYILGSVEHFGNQFSAEAWILVDNHHYPRWNCAPDGSDNANHHGGVRPSMYVRSRAMCTNNRARTERLFQVLRHRSNYGSGWEACGGDVCRVTRPARHAIQNIVLFTRAAITIGYPSSFIALRSPSCPELDLPHTTTRARHAVKTKILPTQSCYILHTNIIRDGGSTTLYTASTAYTVLTALELLWRHII